MVGQAQLWRISILVEMGCVGIDLDLVLIWVEIGNGFCEMMGPVTAGCGVGWLLFWQLHMLVGVKKYIILLLCCVK